MSPLPPAEEREKSISDAEKQAAKHQKDIKDFEQTLEKSAAALEAAKAYQAKLHRQGFGTEPVHDLLKHIKDDIPKIASQKPQKINSR